MDNLKKNFGARLRSHIEDSGLTIDEAADRLGVVRATVYNWLDSPSPPKRRKQLAKLKIFLGNSFEWIAGPIKIKLDDLDEALERELDGAVQESAVPPQDFMRPMDAPTEQELINEFRRTLAAAKHIPGGLGYVAVQLKLHLNPDQIEKLKG